MFSREWKSFYARVLKKLTVWAKGILSPIMWKSLTLWGKTLHLEGKLRTAEVFLVSENHIYITRNIAMCTPSDTFQKDKHRNIWL